MKFIVEPIEHLAEKKCGIVLMNIDHVPPHLAFLYQGVVYGLSLKGASRRETQVFENAMNRSDVKYVLATCNQLESAIFEANEVTRHFRNYSIQEETTCFVPVKKLIASILNQGDAAETFPELFQATSAKGVQWNFFSPCGVNEFILQPYTRYHVMQYIAALTKVNNASSEEK
jgi:hypothetical protein